MQKTWGGRSASCSRRAHPNCSFWVSNGRFASWFRWNAKKYRIRTTLLINHQSDQNIGTLIDFATLHNSLVPRHLNRANANAKNKKSFSSAIENCWRGSPCPVMESYFSSMPSPRPPSRLGNKPDDPKTALSQRRYVVLLVEISSDFEAAFISSNLPISRYESTLSFALVLLWTHPRRRRLVNDPSVWLRPCRRRDVHHPPEEKAKLQKHCLVHAAGTRQQTQATHLTSNELLAHTTRHSCSVPDRFLEICISRARPGIRSNKEENKIDMSKDTIQIFMIGTFIGILSASLFFLITKSMR